MENKWRFRVWKPLFQAPKIVLQVRNQYTSIYDTPSRNFYKWEDAQLEDFQDIDLDKDTWRFRYLRGKLVLQTLKEKEYFYPLAPLSEKVKEWTDATVEDFTQAL